MENLLLVLDEIDDVVGAARHVAPYVFGFIAAAVLFCLTVMAFLYIPRVTVAAVAVMFSIMLIDRCIRRLLTAPLES
jgi:hypothetical protein